MCGLFGAFGRQLSLKNVERLEVLGILSQIRGLDSTGLACIYKDSISSKTISIMMHKNTYDATGFFLSDEGRALFRKPTIPMAYIGHCRAATLGAVSVANAHPYVIDNKVIGTHNGTISAFRPKDVDAETRTDSLDLYERITRKGVLQALADAGWGAAFALVWYDRSTKRINMIRNKERPLFIMKTKEDTFFYASEKRMLDFIANGDPVDVTHLEVDTLYSFNVEDPHDYTKEAIDYRHEISKRWSHSQGGLRNRRGRTFLQKGEAISIPGEPVYTRVSKKTGETRSADEQFDRDLDEFFRTRAPEIQGPEQESAAESEQESSKGAPKSPAKSTALVPYEGGVQTDKPRRFFPSASGSVPATHSSSSGRSSILNRQGGKSPPTFTKQSDRIPTVEEPIQGIPASLPKNARALATHAAFGGVKSGMVASYLFASDRTKRTSYPRYIINTKGDIKVLFYRGPEGLLIPVDNQQLRSLIEAGCMYSAIIPPLSEQVYWINGTTSFILKEHMDSPYVQEFYGYHDKQELASFTTMSNLLYFDLDCAKESNQRRAKELVS